MNKLAIIVVLFISLAFIGFGTFFSVANAIAKIPSKSNLEPVFTAVSQAGKTEVAESDVSKVDEIPKQFVQFLVSIYK